jgi:hypothetical protein
MYRAGGLCAMAQVLEARRTSRASAYSRRMKVAPQPSEHVRVDLGSLAGLYEHHHELHCYWRPHR